MGSALLIWSVLVQRATTDDAPAPWGSNHHPTDVSKRHAQEVTGGRAEYVVVQGGTMDGRNCRSPQGVWQPFEQAWESNRSVRVENIGETDVVNPWLSNGRNDFRSLDRDVAGAIEPDLVNYERKAVDWDRAVEFGTGFVDCTAFFRGLRDGGFRGLAVYEMCSPIRGGGAMENLDKYSAAYLQWLRGGE